MMSAKPPLLHSAVHVAFDSAVPEVLSEVGALHVVRVSDSLLMGPCRADHQENRRARLAWDSTWNQFDQLCEPGIDWQRPIVLWVAESMSQRVSLWRVCNWLSQLGVPASAVYLLSFEAAPPRRPTAKARPPFDCTASVAHHPEEVLLERLARASAIPRTSYEQAARLWEEYAAPDPRPFVEHCLVGLEGWPELGPLWSFLSSFFPRRHADGVLRVSRYDDLLLLALSEEPQTPVQIFLHNSPTVEEWQYLLSGTGDIALAQRLDQWARHGDPPAVKKAAGPKADNPMLSNVFQISDVGQRVRAAGMAALTEAPPWPIAGVEAYSAAAWWVIESSATAARFEQTPAT